MRSFRVTHHRKNENLLNEKKLIDSLHGWRDMVTNTLSLIEKVFINELINNYLC